MATCISRAALARQPQSRNNTKKNNTKAKQMQPKPKKHTSYILCQRDRRWAKAGQQSVQASHHLPVVTRITNDDGLPPPPNRLPHHIYRHRRFLFLASPVSTTLNECTFTSRCVWGWRRQQGRHWSGEEARNRLRRRALRWMPSPWSLRMSLWKVVVAGDDDGLDASRTSARAC